ncbi:diacylglycerol kinase family lipid kinase [candidate division KSB1 bacterium]|nr:diacylglycerol kinase family lipid kinase [candidate division KSB1 bacterium]MBL7093520.1 diacylglycerol kinase family lipid kinase [candidate division KSB1 bacterium]
MTSKNKWIFIINPVAGNGFAKNYTEKIKEIIQKQNLNAEIVFTDRKGHATEIAKDFVDNGFNHIIAVGGDGTFNEVAQILVGKKNVVFGAVPAGTGNDFIAVLGFPGRFTNHEWEILLETNTIKMDVGKCNDKYFLNGMGLGFDAQVAAENYKSDKKQDVKKGNKFKYQWHILKTLVSYKELDMKVTIDGKTTQSKSFLNTISNGRRIAGGLFLTPDAFVNDGMLDVCLIQELKFFSRVKELLHVMKKIHTEDDVVNYFQTKKLLFEFEKEVPAHLDGELYFNSRFEISAVPSSLNIIYNPNGQHYFNV